MVMHVPYAFQYISHDGEFSFLNLNPNAVPTNWVPKEVGYSDRYTRNGYSSVTQRLKRT